MSATPNGDTGPQVRRTWWRHPRAAIVVTCACLVLIVAAAALARTSGGRRVTSSLGIRTAHEPYTSLSFTHPVTLGYGNVRYSRSQVHDQLGFAIANEENRRMTYTWTVSFRPAGRTYRGSATVASDQSTDVNTQVLFPCNHRRGSHPRLTRIQVSVGLQPSGDQIDYWQTCGG